jgi:putative ABC transport system permease protein
MRERLFRALLRLLPAEVREDVAADMGATFRAEHRATPPGAARARLWLGTAADLLRAAPRAHLDILSRDTVVAWRAMRRRPARTGAALVTVTLAVALAVAAFAVVDAVLLAPLPYPDADRLVLVQERGGEGEPGNLGYLTFDDLRRRTRAFAGLAAISQSSAILRGDGREPERVSAMRVSATYLPLLGRAPRLGRWFTEAEDRPGEARRVVVLGDGLWRRRFGADPRVLGRPILLGDTPFTVVGVLAPDAADLIAARLYDDAELWTPLGYDPAAAFACRTCRHLRVVGRLADGTSAEDAAREATAVLAGLAEEHPSQYTAPAAVVRRLDEHFLGPVRPVLLTLAAAVVLLFAAACVSVATLQLLGATERAREAAIRLALGVTPARLARQFLTEAAWLAGLGALAALPLARLAVNAVRVHGPADLPRLADVGLDARAWAVALALAAVTAAAAVVLPLRQALREAPSHDLRADRSTGTSGTWRTRAALLAGNVCLATLLVAGAGLVGRSLLGLLAVHPGLDAAGVLVADVTISGPRYSSGPPEAQIAATTRFYDEALAAVRALPGVEAASATTLLPLGGGRDGFGVHIAGRLHANPEDAPEAERFAVQDDFFATLRIPVIEGRALEARDRAGAPAVAVVNATLAAAIFPGESAIGHTLMLGPPSAPPRTIVGVVGDVRHRGADAPAGYQVYVPQSQWAWAEGAMTVLVRTHGDPQALAAAVRAAIGRVDPAQPVTRLARYGDVVAEAHATRRFAAWLLGGLAGTAWLLSVTALYGAIATLVGQRRRELGIRLALGAASTAIRRQVLGLALRPAAVGVVGGLLFAAAGAGALRPLLFGVAPQDAATYAATAAALLLSAAASALLPAWRASRTDPAIALREE